MLLGAAGIYGAFLMQGIAHEKLISYFRFKESFFMTLVQFFSYSLLSLPRGKGLLTGKTKIFAPLYHYIITAITLGASMTLGNIAAMKLSYPTEVLFKSSKLVPVMIGNIIFLQKIPKTIDVFSVIFTVAGLIGISLGDFKGKNKFSTIGVVAVVGSLISDSAASNLEDKALSVYGASSDELVVVLYGIGSLLIGSVSIITGDFFSALNRIREHPECIPYLIAFGALGSIGIQFIYLIMKSYGSLTTVMMTSLRKAMTVALSFLIYKDKKFTKFHAVSIVMVATGIGMNIYSKLNEGHAKDEEKLVSVVDEQSLEEEESSNKEEEVQV